MSAMTKARPGESSEQRLSRLQRERIDRALTEGEQYGFQEDSSGTFAWCFNPVSGRFYQVTEQSCTCKDFEHRAGPQSLACKHIVRFLAWRENTR